MNKAHLARVLNKPRFHELGGLSAAPAYIPY